jgi:hypothetical protein
MFTLNQAEGSHKDWIVVLCGQLTVPNGTSQQAFPTIRGDNGTRCSKRELHKAGKKYLQTFAKLPEYNTFLVKSSNWRSFVAIGTG